MKYSYAGLKLASPAVLAPMSGVSTLPFRLLCKELGAGLTYTEFASAIAIARSVEGKRLSNNKVFSRVKTVKEEHPVGVQLFAPNEKDLCTAIEYVERDFDLVDINFGCPSPKITGGGCGAFLLKTPEKIISLLNAAVSISNKPITCKLRMGWDTPVLHEFVKKIENTGIQGIALHARTAQQGYSGSADWEYIKKIKNLVSIPVIGNGDVSSASEVLDKIENNYCDLVMVGRGAWNHPALFAEVSGKPVPLRKEIILRYLELVQKHPVTDFSDVKAQLSGMLSGLHGVKSLRVQLMQAKDLVHVERVIHTAVM
ncbi:MAG: tRNA-dihydrouridine synthase family protein [Candidatus Diapherotrites archaeon]|uniref:tRNA-dihydrouridine synthase family protein n=1 Tax=Candidatus Iainarchaeum sp. TaxID=3101447 RepID=A0A8T4C6S0_9ARCH|nr:tRNA-dihydrouridine synthase family protein [Candidatus Diapherotrites archaeon]